MVEMKNLKKTASLMSKMFYGALARVPDRYPSCHINICLFPIFNFVQFSFSVHSFNALAMLTLQLHFMNCLALFTSLFQYNKFYSSGGWNIGRVVYSCINMR